MVGTTVALNAEAEKRYWPTLQDLFSCVMLNVWVLAHVLVCFPEAHSRDARKETYREDKLETRVGHGHICIRVSNKTVCLAQQVVCEQIQTMICHWVVKVG